MTIDPWIDNQADRILAAVLEPPLDSYADDAEDLDRLAYAVDDFLAGPDPHDLVGPSDRSANLLLAAIGYPAPEDVDSILGDPAKLAELRSLWVRNPPDADLWRRATLDAGLARLLTAAGFPTEAPASAHPSSAASQARLGARRRPHYILAAAEAFGSRHVQPLPGGRFIRESLADGTVVLTVDLEGAGPAGQRPPGDEPSVVRVISVGPAEEAAGALHLLLLLQPQAADSPDHYERTTGQALVTHAAALGAVDVSAPVPLSSLNEADLAAVPDSVVAARGEWNLGWRSAARHAGKGSPLYEAVLRGARRAL